MNIGLFDSGLGGLIITRAVATAMPEYNYVYLGDTLHVPYGARSATAVYEFTRACVDALFRQHDCALVIIACNTASIAALRRLQQEYLPQNFPDRRILGVVIPTAEAAAESGAQRIGLLATDATARSTVYSEEIKKLIPNAELFPVAAPLLVPLIENNGDKFAEPILREYLDRFPKIDTLILGCTHFPHYKNEIAKMMPGVRILSQDEIIPEKLRDYLSRHPDLCHPHQRGAGAQSATGGGNKFYVTDISESYMAQAARLFGQEIEIEKTNV